MFPGGFLKSGQGVTPKIVNQIAEGLYQGDRVTGSGFAMAGRIGGAVQIRDFSNYPVYLMRIMANLGSGKYTANQITAEPTTGTKTEIESDYGGVIVDDEIPLLELNGLTTVPVGTYVPAWINPTQEPGYVFSGAGLDSGSTGVLDQCRTVVDVCRTRTEIEALTSGSSAADIVAALQAEVMTVSYRGWCGYVTGATYSSGTATITTTEAPPAELVGQTVYISGIDPTGYNGSFIVLAVSGSTFDVPLTTDPGSYVSDGLVSAPNVVYCVDDPEDCCETGTDLPCCDGSPFVFPATLAPTLTNTSDREYSPYVTGWTIGDETAWIALSGGGSTPPSYPYSYTTIASGALYYKIVYINVTGFIEHDPNFAFYFFVGCSGGDPFVQVVPPYYGITSTGSWVDANTFGGASAAGTGKVFSCGSTWNPVNENIGSFDMSTSPYPPASGTIGDGSYDIVIP